MLLYGKKQKTKTSQLKSYYHCLNWHKLTSHSKGVAKIQLSLKFYVFSSHEHNDAFLQVIQDETTIVRQAYAENIATIAETALRSVLLSILCFFFFCLHSDRQQYEF